MLPRKVDGVAGNIALQHSYGRMYADEFFRKNMNVFKAGQ